jgi:hypothetical protein
MCLGGTRENCSSDRLELREISARTETLCTLKVFQKKWRAHTENHQKFLKFLKIVTIMTIIQDHFSTKMLGVTIT